MDMTVRNHSGTPVFKEKDLSDLQLRILETLNWLASFGADPNGGVTRTLYTPPWFEAQQALEHRMSELGFEPFYDDVGNLFGRLAPSQTDEGAILIGSHVDTVQCGGKYDGAFGIAAGLLALHYLKENYGDPKRPLEIVSFCEEEGSRFPITFWGSSNIAGTAPPADIRQIRDTNNISLQAAMQEAGFGFGRYRHPRRTDIAAFIELHIEQGAVLEREQLPIGLVEQIVGQKRYTIECTGEANHAGTTPMTWRKDALRGSSQMIAAIMESAEFAGAPLVATVGKIEAEPNVSNVIAQKVVFSLDVRHPKSDVLDMFCEEALAICRRIGQQRKLQVKIEKHLDVLPVEMDSALLQTVEEICSQLSIPYKIMSSGAGHDTQIMAPHYPTSLIFVPSKGGISHSPQEYTSKEEMASGVQVLIELLYRLGYQEEAVPHEI